MVHGALLRILRRAAPYLLPYTDKRVFRQDVAISSEAEGWALGGARSSAIPAHKCLVAGAFGRGDERSPRIHATRTVRTESPPPGLRHYVLALHSGASTEVRSESWQRKASMTSRSSTSLPKKSSATP
ncbi:hypothetical protein VUR80DRAFT_4476 [Thermomyces stellatus]